MTFLGYYWQIVYLLAQGQGSICLRQEKEVTLHEKEVTLTTLDLMLEL